MTPAGAAPGAVSASAGAWGVLFLAIVGELVGTACLKLVDGGKKPWAWLGVVAGYGAALYLLERVIQRIDIGVVYAVWSGVGICLVAAFGAVVFHEALTPWRVIGLLTVVVGIVILQLTAATPASPAG